MNLSENEDLLFFAGAGLLTAFFAVLGLWKEPFISVACAQFGAIVGAAAMRMRPKQ